MRGENDKRKSIGKKAKEKWGEQNVFEDKFRFAQGISNPDARKLVMRTLYGGVLQEYGLDVCPERKPMSDNGAMDEQLLEAIQAEVDSGSSPLEQLPSRGDLEDKNVPQLQKVARENNIPYEKTDTKEELMAKISQ